ncbi:unnamed protein product [Rhizophagus irregularis]|nr:unnamed protein product [Rhizophagus irregularis]
MKLNHISLFISLSIILLTLSSVKSSIIFEENQPLSAEILRVFNIDCYDDNTMVVRIVRKDPSKFHCFEEYLSIRTIYPNGTVKGFDLPSDTLNMQNMQPFNFCIPPKYSKANPLRFYPIKKNFLFITYAEADDITNPFTYNDWGIVIDLDGVIHSKIKLGPSDENGGIQQIVETVNIFPTGHPLETVATMDGGYALIYPNNTGLTGSKTISTTPLTPQFGIYFLLLGYEKGITQGPFVLYQTLTPINVLLLDCDFTYVGVGQTCIIIANSTQSDKTFIKIDFLSSGTVYNITTFQNINVTDYSIQSLRYGGYFTYYLVRNSDKKNFNIYGYILDYYGILFNWDLTYPTLANPVADFNSFEIYECGTSIAKFTTTILFTSIDAGAVENIFTTRFCIHNYNNDDLLEKGNNHDSETNNETTKELNKISERIGKLQKVNEPKEELKNVRIELEKFKEDLNGFKEITKNLKNVNDLINKLISPNGISLKEVKSVMENLEKIKQLIESIKQVEDFINELKEVFNFVKELKTIEHINEEDMKDEVKEVLNKANKLQVKLKADLSKDLKKVNKLIKELKQININIEEFIEELKKANDLMNELEEIINKLMEELKKAKELKENLIEAKKHIIDLGIKNEEELFNKHELIEGLEEVTKFMEFIEFIQVELSPSTDDNYVKDKSLQYYYVHIKESEDCKCWSYIQEVSKELIHKINVIKDNMLETIKKKIYGEKTDQQYRKFSKWLKDYRNNKIVIVIFTILAGIDISHLDQRCKFKLRDLVGLNQ